MLRFFLALVFGGMSFTCLGAAERTTLKAAIERGQVKIVATTTGKSYKDKALKLQLTNTTRDALNITVDPALIFKPEEEGYQHLVLPAEEMLALAPGGHGEIEVRTFCGKASAMGPGSKLTYKFWKQGDSSLIKVTKYIKKNNLYDELGQHAVWAITDNHDLDGIIDPARPKESAELLALLVKVTGRPTPPYFRLYKLDTVAGQPVFQKRVLKIVANVEWKLAEAKKLTMGIYNQTGDLVQGVFEEKPMAKGSYKMQVQFEAEGAPKGAYYMRLKEGDILMKEVKVVVD
jgi:hypothetical protein